MKLNLEKQQAKQQEDKTTNNKRETMNKYKYDEIKSHFEDYINDMKKEEIKENIDDLHHDIFNSDYYVIGRYEAKKWLGDQVFNIIETIREYEEFNFGEVNTDFSEPEKVVNMYVYIIGEEVINDYRNQLEDEVA